MTLYYMRDNHTFRRLEGTVPEMLQAVKDEFDAGYSSGMLCDSEHKEGVLHAPSCFETFTPKAEEWLCRSNSTK